MKKKKKKSTTSDGTRSLMRVTGTFSAVFVAKLPEDSTMRTMALKYLLDEINANGAECMQGPLEIDPVKAKLAVKVELPDGWDEYSEPWGDNDDATIGELLEELEQFNVERVVRECKGNG